MKGKHPLHDNPLYQKVAKKRRSIVAKDADVIKLEKKFEQIEQRVSNLEIERYLLEDDQVLEEYWICTSCHEIDEYYFGPEMQSDGYHEDYKQGQGYGCSHQPIKVREIPGAREQWKKEIEE